MPTSGHQGFSWPLYLILSRTTNALINVSHTSKSKKSKGTKYKDTGRKKDWQWKLKSLVCYFAHPLMVIIGASCLASLNLSYPLSTNTEKWDPAEGLNIMCVTYEHGADNYCTTNNRLIFHRVLFTVYCIRGHRRQHRPALLGLGVSCNTQLLLPSKTAWAMPALQRPVHSGCHHHLTLHFQTLSRSPAPSASLPLP